MQTYMHNWLIHVFFLLWGFQRLHEGVHWVSCNAQRILDLQKTFDTIHPVVVEVMWDVFDLVDLLSESRIFSLLSNVCLVDHILQNHKFFLQVSFNVCGLCHGNFFNSVLFTLQNLHLFLAICVLLLQLNDLFFKLVNTCFETKRLLWPD